MTRIRDDGIRPFDADEDLLEEAVRLGRPRFRVYPWRGRVVVLGRGSDPRREVRREALRDPAVSLLRRRGGGCAVLLDPGNLVVSLAFPAEGTGRITRAFDASLAWLLRGLEAAGFRDIRREGISDLAQGDRKVGGTCLYRKTGLVYFSATLLAAPDLDLVERILPHPPREPAWRRGRPHREFMGALEGPKESGDPAALAPLLEASLPPGPEGFTRMIREDPASQRDLPESSGFN